MNAKRIASLTLIAGTSGQRSALADRLFQFKRAATLAKAQGVDTSRLERNRDLLKKRLIESIDAAVQLSDHDLLLN